MALSVACQPSLVLGGVVVAEGVGGRMALGAGAAGVAGVDLVRGALFVV